MQLQIIKTEHNKANIDIKFSMRDQAACEARNSAAKAENIKRLRAAELTAKWDCDDSELRCKWTYDTVVLAEEENCADPLAGNNHKALAAEAQLRADRLVEEKGEYD